MTNNFTHLPKIKMISSDTETSSIQSFYTASQVNRKCAIQKSAVTVNGPGKAWA